jgi:hypothetical protein
MTDRAGEIWSTRIQQELLALTTDNADMEATESRSMLPPFTTVKDHALDIAAGTCVVSVQVDVTKPSTATEEQSTVEPRCILVALDASLPKNDDGSVNTGVTSYPFVPPVVRLLEGQAVFPKGSTIQDGQRIGTDLDWTPSLHLTDAILNVGLKIKESVLQGEPFHPAPEPHHAVVDDVTKGARRFASSLSKKVGRAFSPKARQQRQSPSSKQSPKHIAKSAKTRGDVKIGDEINLLEEPWVEAHGVYSCKAIRRPPFIEEAIAQASLLNEQQAFSSPTAMFRSFAQSARSVIEESFLMITETDIIELRANKLNVSVGTVVFCIPIDMMAKLKFRREESLSLFFKSAPDDPLIYMCPDSGDAVHQIQSVLKRHGVRGKHTNAAAFRAINEAMQLVQEIQTKELALKHDPNVERVNEIMDLYRQAAERFEAAGDIRHEEVVTHMRKFLALPQTVAILDGSFQKPEGSPKQSPSGSVPEGEVLERTDAQLEDVDDMDGSGNASERVSKEKENDKAFEDNIDNLLKDAKADFEKFNVDGEGTLETDAPSADSSAGDDNALADVAADLDALMKEADKELDELLSS